MDDVKAELIEVGEDSELVTIEVILDILENNRTRIRDLGKMVLTVCGFLLSASFVVLFFVLQNQTSQVLVAVALPLFGATASLVLSTLFSVLSSMVPSPTAVRTKFELIDVLVQIYHREHRRVIWAVVFLILAIILFVAALVVFALLSL